MHFADELLEHLLGDRKVGDHAVLHRADDGDGARCLAQHVLGGQADGLNRLLGVWAAFHADGHNRGLVKDYTSAAHVNQCVGRAEVNCQIVRKITA